MIFFLYLPVIFIALHYSRGERGPVLAQDRCAAPHGSCGLPGPRPRACRPRMPTPSPFIYCFLTMIRELHPAEPAFAGIIRFDTILDFCVSSLRRGHANLLCIVPILTDDLRRGSTLGEHCLSLYICIFLMDRSCELSEFVGFLCSSLLREETVKKLTFNDLI